MTSLPPTLLPESTHAQHHWRGSARRRRILLLVLVLGQTLAATWLLLAVLPYHGRTAVEVGIAVLFGLLFTWLSLGFWIALTGFVLRRRGGDPRAIEAREARAHDQHVDVGRQRCCPHGLGAGRPFPPPGIGLEVFSEDLRAHRGLPCPVGRVSSARSRWS